MSKSIDPKEDDFIAVLKYKTADDGGRKTAAASGYRPTIKFSFSTYQTSARQTFIDKELVYPGDTVKANIKMASPHVFKKCLIEGMGFEFREGPIIIGTGLIITILNIELKK